MELDDIGEWTTRPRVFEGRVLAKEHFEDLRARNGECVLTDDWAPVENLLAPVVRRLKKSGFRVSLFANPDPAGMGAAKATGADRVELYTGPYGGCHDDSAKAANELELLAKAAEAAQGQGLGVNAGHDLTVANLPALAARIPLLAEVSIGHGLTADALEYGMEGTVRRFLAACGWPA